MTLLRADLAPPARTLMDVFEHTVDTFPDAPAIDNGAQVLTYAELAEAVDQLAAALGAAGVGTGDRVGIRIGSGTLDLYVAILGTLAAGAAYVPVDVDDPDERARTVFEEADVAAVIGTDLAIAVRRARPPVQPTSPLPHDDAWIIFTSGSTGTPKGVAVSHRSAAAFVDAEARLFLTDAPLGVGDRVMAGLSVAFDASCEEMWLAWRNGACLVPAPRSLVRSGMDLGPWLTANDVTVVSTVPTLVALWPVDALADVRLLILGGEACPPEIGTRLASATREVWNTYGPTEATVVACGARLTGEPPVRIGLPLDGWDLAVVDAEGRHVPEGEVGELIIGGVGLARYLDPVKDAEKYAGMPGLGWDRAYRSGDLVRYDPAGLVFVGRGDEQVKLGGRRIELGEVDSALLALPGVTGAAAAVRSSASGNQLLVGYLTTDDTFSVGAAMAALRTSMPASMVPRLAQVPTLPTRTSGKIDRDALPWPLPTAEPPAGSGGAAASAPLSGTAAWIDDLWAEILGTGVQPGAEDFFTLGGGSLTAAQLVSRLRARFPEATVADVYERPGVHDLAAALDQMAAPQGRTNSKVRPVPLKTQAGQALTLLPLRTLTGLRWLTWVGIANEAVRTTTGLTWLPSASWPVLAVAWLLLVSAPGRLLLTALGARAFLRGLVPGAYPRGGKVHLRLWAAERLADELGVGNVSGAPWLRLYARALGARIGAHVDLHSIPPVTGMLHLGSGASVEPEVDLTGHWVDGGTLHVGEVRVAKRARVGARSLIAPGVTVGAGADVGPGSSVLSDVPAGQYWAGGPAHAVGPARGPWDDRAPENRPAWVLGYGAMAVLVSALPVLATVVALLPALPWLRDAGSLTGAAVRAFAVLPLATLLGYAVLALLVWGLVRALALGLTPGHHPIHGRRAWQAWATFRVLDEARSWLFPIYSSSATPAWLRALGAKIGSDVEASTVLMLPALTTVGDGAFLADDTLLGGYELGGGWLRVESVKVGKRAFLGNSAMTAPGRRVPKGGLVAVLSAAPRRTQAKAGTSWLGSPPTRLRRQAEVGDTSRTYAPSRRLRVARAGVELARFVPVLVAQALGVSVVVALELLADTFGWGAAATLSGCVLAVAGLVAAAVTTAGKWLLVGRLRAGDHPLWSSFVWRNELADTFVELVAAPWFARPTAGTAVLAVWFRSLGVRVGRGVWCETYWLPEADLVTLADGVTVNQGSVVQTHLFHDRMLSMDHVTLRAGATLGPHGVVLPAATLGRHATVGPMSLVMRGESVPDRTRWVGNPIGPWVEAEE